MHRRCLRSGSRGPDEQVDDVTVAPVDEGCDGATTDIVDTPADQRKAILGKIADLGADQIRMRYSAANYRAYYQCVGGLYFGQEHNVVLGCIRQ
jgi:hypothetical protein